MESECVEPNFDVFGSEKDLGPREGFVVGCVTVGFEARLEKGAFRGGEPGDGGWVVGYEEVG